MNLKTFTGPTMIACLNQVKSEMGPNAVILHTRTFTKRKWLGISRQEFVEITAGRGLPKKNHAPMGGGGNMLPMQQVAPQNGLMLNAMPASSPQMAAYLNSPSPKSLAINSQSTALVAAAAPPQAPGKLLLESPVANQIVGIKVQQDVEELKKLVGNLVDRIQKKDAPNVPEELFNYYLKLVENQVAEELASEIVTTLRNELRPEHFRNDAYVREKIAEQIEGLIPTTGPIIRKKLVGPHVVALIGPTGVGKTTTIAKLAANLKLREKRRVGLITLDTYRIAAIDQLKKYADILGADLRVVGSVDDLKIAIQQMNECEFILIDTAGRSPRDSMKINELKTFLQTIQPDEVHLVLSSTASQECVEFAVERFSEVNFDKVIFTKLDEAMHVGTLLNVLRKVKKSLSYVTTGQDVPDDIEVGQGRRLAKWILDGDMC